MSSPNWLFFAQRLHALANTGLFYTESQYDRERYEEINEISLQMLAHLSDATPDVMIKLLPPEIGYQTPKVDIRCVIVNEKQEMLMVQEKMDDNRWTLPGGWADVGYSPFEVAEKESFEETGLKVKAMRLLSVFDKKMHNHPPQPWYVYKMFVLCEVVGGELLSDTNETSGGSWVNRKALSTLTLSPDRVTLPQLEKVCDLIENLNLPTLCD